MYARIYANINKLLSIYFIIAFDVDGDNRLNKQEFAKALKYMGQACPPGMVYIYMIYHVTPPPTHYYYTVVNHIILHIVLVIVLSCHYLYYSSHIVPYTLSSDKLDSFFSKVDTDGSGFIEWNEFLAVCTALTHSCNIIYLSISRCNMIMYRNVLYA